MRWTDHDVIKFCMSNANKLGDHNMYNRREKVWKKQKSVSICEVSGQREPNVWIVWNYFYNGFKLIESWNEHRTLLK